MCICLAVVARPRMSVCAWGGMADTGSEKEVLMSREGLIQTSVGGEELMRKLLANTMVWVLLPAWVVVNEWRRKMVSWLASSPTKTMGAPLNQ